MNAAVVAPWWHNGGGVSDMADVRETLVGDGAEHWMDEVFPTWADYRTHFGINPDHPTVGENGAYAAELRANIPLNAVILTGLCWKYRGVEIRIPAGVYKMAGSRGSMTVVFKPEKTDDGRSDGELGPIMVGEHYRKVVFDFSGIGQAANKGFVGPYTGLTEVQQRHASTSFPTRPVTAGPRRVSCPSCDSKVFA